MDAVPLLSLCLICILHSSLRLIEAFHWVLLERLGEISPSMRSIAAGAAESSWGVQLSTFTLVLYTFKGTCDTLRTKIL